MTALANARRALAAALVVSTNLVAPPPIHAAVVSSSDATIPALPWVLDSPKAPGGVLPDLAGLSVVSGDAALAALSSGQWRQGFEIAAAVLAAEQPDMNALGVFALGAAMLDNRAAVDSALNRLRQVEEQPYVALLTQGVVDFRTGAAQKAETSFSTVLKKYPNDPLALYFVGELLSAQKKDSEALQKFKAVLTTWPEFVPALAAAARLQSSAPRGDLKEALALVERAVAVEPRNPALKKQLADLYERTGQKNKAGETYIGLLAGLSTDRDVHLRGAWAQLNAGQPERAVRQLDAVVKEHGPLPVAYLLRAMADVDQGKHDTLAVQLNAYVDANPAKSQANEAAALVHLARGDAGNAKRHIEVALAVNPTGGRAWLTLAVIEQVALAPSNAAAALKKATASGEDAAFAAFILANLELATGNETGFRQSLAKAGGFLPGAEMLQLSAPGGASAATERNVAAIMLVNGWSPQIVRHADNALETSPRDAIALFFRGRALLVQGRAESAVGSLSRAVEIEPRFVGAQLALGAAQSMRRDPNAALAAYQATLAIRPELVSAQLGAAAALLDLQRKPEALALMRKAEGKAADCPAVFQLALLNERGGARDSAGELLKKTLRIASCAPVRPQAQRLLARFDVERSQKPRAN